MPKSTAYFLNQRRNRAKRFRGSGTSTTPPAPEDPSRHLSPATRHLLAAKAAVQEIGQAFTAAEIWNVCTLESRPRRIEVHYRCPGVRCIHHGHLTEDNEGNGGRHGSKLSTTPCPVIGLLVRLVNSGVLAKQRGRSGGVAWSPAVQVCRHSRSGMRVVFESMKAEG